MKSITKEYLIGLRDPEDFTNLVDDIMSDDLGGDMHLHEYSVRVALDAMTRFLVKKLNEWEEEQETTQEFTKKELEQIKEDVNYHHFEYGEELNELSKSILSKIERLLN